MYTMSMCVYVYSVYAQAVYRKWKTEKEKEKFFVQSHLPLHQLLEQYIAYSSHSSQSLPLVGYQMCHPIFFLFTSILSRKRRRRRKKCLVFFFFLSCVFFFLLFSLLPHIFSTMSSVAKPLRSPFSMDCKYFPSLSLIKDIQISGTKQLRFQWICPISNTFST